MQTFLNLLIPFRVGIVHSYVLFNHNISLFYLNLFSRIFLSIFFVFLELICLSFFLSCVNASILHFQNSFLDYISFLRFLFIISLSSSSIFKFESFAISAFFFIYISLLYHNLLFLLFFKLSSTSYFPAFILSLNFLCFFFSFYPSFNSFLLGANACIPYTLCYESMGGLDPDFLGV